jgi:hypothetical protein
MQNAKGSILMSIVLLGALSLIPASVNAQVECLGRCERNLTLCLAAGTEQPSGCLTAYEICVDECLGSVAALL